MNDEQAKIKLTEIIASIDDIYLRSPVLKANAQSQLRDLGIDSLGKITLFYGIIDHYGITLEENVANEWKCLSDVLEFIKAQG